MRGFKASLIILIITCAACFIMLGWGNIFSFSDFKVWVTAAANEETPGETVPEEGEFPGNMRYLHGDNRYIYYTEYNKNDKVYLYHMDNGVSQLLLETVRPENIIGTFERFEGTIAWREEKSALPGHDGSKVHDTWEIFIRKDGKTHKVDEGELIQSSSEYDIFPMPQRLSLYGDYLVYRAYGQIPGSRDEGIVIKLYDIKKDSHRTIFSLKNADKYYVSDPCIYKDYVVWSTGELEMARRGIVKKGDLYIYNIKTGSYGKVMEGEDLTDPLIWEQYIVCTRRDGRVKALGLYNIKTGVMEDIFASDYTVFPWRELQDYSIGEGYVAWNDSCADSLRVYDLINGEIRELAKRSSSEEVINSLLNIRIYGRNLLYKDHAYYKDSGRTAYDINRYILLP